MWREEEIINYLKESLDNKRFDHTLRVRDTAVLLSIHYGVDIEKAALAALIHDCAKNKSVKEILEIIYERNYEIEEIDKDMPHLLHGIAGALIGRNLMGIEDEEVLNASIYHTTGRENMSLLEKIIYLADYIEPGREFKGLDKIRKMVYEDIDKALLLALDKSIKYIIDSKEIIHVRTIEARNYLLKNPQI